MGVKKAHKKRGREKSADVNPPSPPAQLTKHGVAGWLALGQHGLFANYYILRSKESPDNGRHAVALLLGRHLEGTGNRKDFTLLTKDPVTNRVELAFNVPLPAGAETLEDMASVLKSIREHFKQCSVEDCVLSFAHPGYEVDSVQAPQAHGTGGGHAPQMRASTQEHAQRDREGVQESKGTARIIQNSVLRWVVGVPPDDKPIAVYCLVRVQPNEPDSVSRLLFVMAERVQGALWKVDCFWHVPSRAGHADLERVRPEPFLIPAPDHGVSAEALLCKPFTQLQLTRGEPLVATFTFE